MSGGVLLVLVDGDVALTTLGRDSVDEQLEVKGPSSAGGGLLELKGPECEVGGGAHALVSLVGIGGLDTGAGVDRATRLGSHSWLSGRKDIAVSRSILLVLSSVEVDVELFADHDELGSTGDAEGRHGEWVVDGTA